MRFILAAIAGFFVAVERFLAVTSGDRCSVFSIALLRCHVGVVVSWAGASGCRRDLHQFFADRTNSVALLALTRAMEHMVRGSALGGYRVDCEPCWDLFKQLRQSCELP